MCIVCTDATMDKTVMPQLIAHLFGKKEDKKKLKNRLLFLDNQSTHVNFKQEFKDVRIQPVYLPARSTPYLQPVDVTFNKPYKANLRNEWMNWLDKKPEWTKYGNRKKPSYEEIVWLDERAANAIPGDSIRRSFECCGMRERGKKVQDEELHRSLREIMKAKKKLMFVQDCHDLTPQDKRDITAEKYEKQQLSEFRKAAATSSTATSSSRNRSPPSSSSVSGSAVSSSSVVGSAVNCSDATSDVLVGTVVVGSLESVESGVVTSSQDSSEPPESSAPSLYEE